MFHAKWDVLILKNLFLGSLTFRFNWASYIVVCSIWQPLWESKGHIVAFSLQKLVGAGRMSCSRADSPTQAGTGRLRL